MTQPDLSPEQLAPELVGTGAQAIVDNAQRLGLTWQLKLATVVTGTDSSTVLAIYDDDTVAIEMTPMLGYPPSAGDRVYVIAVPPSGNFIVGKPVITGAPYFRRYSVSGLTSLVVTIPTNVRHVSALWKCNMTSGGAVFMLCRVNSNATANQHITLGFQQTSAASAVLQTTATEWTIGVVPQVASSYGAGTLDIWEWDKPTVGYLPFQARSATPAAGVNNYYLAVGGHFIPVGPYNSLLFFGTGGVAFGAGSEIQVEGYY